MVGSRCVVQGCSNGSNRAAGIALHASPTNKSARDAWARFVKTKRKNFHPYPRTRFVVCSVHFEESCFTRAFDPSQRRQIKPGSLPSIWKKGEQTTNYESQRSVRMKEKKRHKVLQGLLESSILSVAPCTNVMDSNQNVLDPSAENHSDFLLDAVMPSEQADIPSEHANFSEAVMASEQADLAEAFMPPEYFTGVIIPSSAPQVEQFGDADITDVLLESSHYPSAASPCDYANFTCGVYDATTSPLQEQAKADAIVEPNSVTAKPTEALLLNEASTQTEVDDHSRDPSFSPTNLPTDKPQKATPCSSYDSLRKQKKKLQRQLRGLESKLETNQANWTETFQLLNRKPEVVSTESQTDDALILNEDEVNVKEELDYDEAMDIEDETKGEPQEGQAIDDEGDPDWTPEEADNAYEQAGDDECDQKPNPKLNCEGKNYREEPKAIVFLSKLLLLFQTCHVCFATNPLLSISQSGTMISIKSTCRQCNEVFTWDSQPFILGKFPAGNLLLSFAILCSGASISKVLLVFKHMGVLVYHFPTYFYHQRHLLVPSIVKYWRGYQAELLRKLNGEEVVLAGDGRHDSMGHSAKYGTYTIFCCTIGYIIHIVLVQANQAGSSSAMEFDGHQKAFAFLLGTAMIIKAFISDRHSQIAKWMKVECPKRCKELGKPVIDHFFDLWHIGKKIQKLLTKLSKEKGMEAISRWRKACVRHFYWSVTSTQQKLAEVILAKFKSFQHHIINQHTNIPEKWFNKCAHGVVTTQRLWLTKGSEVYSRLCETLNKSSLLKGIKQASPVQQTSCLEGYHSVVNQFAPKMLAFSYLGLLSRTVLAALHFNWNLRRESLKDGQGNSKLRVTYPKFKEGEGTVREARVQQNYGYVAKIYDTLVTTPRDELKQLKNELAAQVPEPLHTLLKDKESKAEAKEKYLSRKKMETVICPPTCSDAELQQLQNPAPSNTDGKRPRKPPTCKKCGLPRKGHKKGQCSSTSSE